MKNILYLNSSLAAHHVRPSGQIINARGGQVLMRQLAKCECAGWPNEMRAYNPKWYIDDTTVFHPSDYRFDGFAKHLKLKTKNGIKIDFLLNEALINKPIKNELLDLEFDLYFESVEDIIAKKIKYRKEDNLTRDIFDLAVSISKDAEILKNLLLTRFVTTDDLQKLNESLKNLDAYEYKTELEKIEPQPYFSDISINAKDIIQNNINQALLGL